ncbi:hypothetical protein SRO_5182 [Streptomyces rochei]|nr:hypothetical protein SRO_5182 [Streptomyces rochei]
MRRGVAAIGGDEPLDGAGGLAWRQSVEHLGEAAAEYFGRWYGGGHLEILWRATGTPDRPPSALGPLPPGTRHPAHRHPDRRRTGIRASAARHPAPGPPPPSTRTAVARQPNRFRPASEPVPPGTRTRSGRLPDR